MAISMKCDRCGRDIPPRDQLSDSGRIRIQGAGRTLKQMDLCAHDKNELLKKVDEFLRH